MELLNIKVSSSIILECMKTKFFSCTKTYFYLLRSASIHLVLYGIALHFVKLFTNSMWFNSNYTCWDKHTGALWYEMWKMFYFWNIYSSEMLRWENHFDRTSEFKFNTSVLRIKLNLKFITLVIKRISCFWVYSVQSFFLKFRHHFHAILSMLEVKTDCSKKN